MNNSTTTMRAAYVRSILNTCCPGVKLVHMFKTGRINNQYIEMDP